MLGRYGRPPAPIDPAVRRAVELRSDGATVEEPLRDLDELRDDAEGLAASEEELVLLAMFGAEAEDLLRTIRARHSRDSVLIAEDADAERGERIRELVKIVQESGVGEIEIEDEGMRVSVRRADEPGSLTTTQFSAETPNATEVEITAEPVVDGVARVESPMVGIFYRAPNPGALGTRIRGALPSIAVLPSPAQPGLRHAGDVARVLLGDGIGPRDDETARGGRPDGVLELGVRRVRQGVPRFRTVQRDDADVAARLERQLGVRHVTRRRR